MAGLNDTGVSGSPVVFDPATLPNDTSTWSESMRNSVFSARAHTRVVTRLLEDPSTIVGIDEASSTNLFAGYRQADDMDAWRELFHGTARVTFGTDDQDRVAKIERRVLIERVLVHTTEGTRWLNVNLTPSRLMDLFDQAWKHTPPDVTTPREPRRVEPDRSSLHRAITTHGMDTVLDDVTCASVIRDLCLDPLAPPHLGRWDRSRGQVPTYS